MDFLTDLPITIDRSSRTPLAVQVADALRDAAARGSVRGGDRLPSSRALGDRLGVSRTVTAAAYDQLHAEGWIAGRHGSGTYVTTSPSHGLERRLPPAIDAVPERLIDLAPGAPCVEVIDPAAWRRAWRAASDAPLLLRPHRAGLPEYRVAVAEHLLRHRGLSGHTGEGVLLATAGTSTATGEVAAAMFRPGDAVAIEDPGYGRAVGALEAAGMRVVPVPVDDDGLRIDELADDVRAIYCTPAHQYPLGARMPAGRRVQLVDLARRNGMLVIEDDYDGELRYDTAPLPLLAAIGPDVVVHLGTTSKILTPTLGVGWMVAPPTVAEQVLANRELTGTGPSAAGQRVLTEFARSGDLARHLRRLRRDLSARRSLVVDEFRAAGLRVIGDDAGAHVVVPLPSSNAETSVIAAAHTAGIRLDGLARHHYGTPRHHGIPLGYTACSRDELRRCLPLIVEQITQL